MALSGRKLTVIGGGVAGLAVALACARRGAAVEVLEQAPAIAEVGAGLQIAPNGARVLRALGLGEALDRAGMRAAAVELRDGIGGEKVLRMPMPGAPAEGQFMLHRADLIALLLEAARAAGVAVTPRAQVLRVVPGAPQAVLEMADGSRRRAGLAIGADGLRSVARAALNDAEAPFFTGQIAWRAVIEGDGGEPVPQVFMAPGRHLVSYPLRGGTRRNIAAFEERAEWVAEGWHLTGDAGEFRRRFREFGGPVPGWLRAVGEVHLWGLFRHEVAARWWGPGCALLGDAAHPTLPFMAQGANMALEDGWVLARCLDEISETDQALAAYQTARRERVARIVATAGRNARLYHLGPPLRAPVHLAMRLGGAVAPGLPLRRFDWIFRHDVTQGG